MTKTEKLLGDITSSGDYLCHHAVLKLCWFVQDLVKNFKTLDGTNWIYQWNEKVLKCVLLAILYPPLLAPTFIEIAFLSLYYINLKEIILQLQTLE